VVVIKMEALSDECLTKVAGKQPYTCSYIKIFFRFTDPGSGAFMNHVSRIRDG
jgi:hypothetical protein